MEKVSGLIRSRNSMSLRLAELKKLRSLELKVKADVVYAI